MERRKFVVEFELEAPINVRDYVQERLELLAETVIVSEVYPGHVILSASEVERVREWIYEMDPECDRFQWSRALEILELLGRQA